MRSDPLEILVQSKNGNERRVIPIGSVAGARYSSRDVAGMRKQLDAMLARGESGTKTNPSIFQIGRYLLTQEAEFEVQGPLTGGEAEIVVIRDKGEILITVGSDQCDRELDPLFQDKPKQMCPHPIGRCAWIYKEVRDHWDNLKISSHVTVGEHIVPLQDCAASELVDLEYLLTMKSVQSLILPSILYCGAAPVLDSIVNAIEKYSLPEETSHGVCDSFLARLHDPVLNRTIEHRYRAIPLGDDLAERD